MGQIREDTAIRWRAAPSARASPSPTGSTIKVNECLVEGEGVDLLAMGRPEGPGCYCAANNMLRECIDRLGDALPLVVIDNEAGMEHISRQTTRDIDQLFIISDPTLRGLVAAELHRAPGRVPGHAHRGPGSVVNRISGDVPEAVRGRADALGVPLLGTLPEDPAISRYDLEGRPLVELDDSSDLSRCEGTPGRVPRSSLTAVTSRGGRHVHHW